MSCCFNSSKILRSATMLRSRKIYVPLLWGLCVLFASSIPETTSANVAIEANDTTTQPTTAHVKVSRSTAWNPEHKPEEVSASAPAVQTVSPMVAKETSEASVSKKTNGSDGSRDGSAIVTAVAAATSSSGLLASTKALEAPAVTSARGEAKPSTNVTTASTEAHPSATATVAITSMTTTTAEAQPSSAANTAAGEPSTAASVALTETQRSAVATTAKDEVQPSPSVTTATREASTLNVTTRTDTLNHTADQLCQSSTASFTNETSTATSSTASGATVAVSSLQPTATTGTTLELPSTTSLNTQNVSSFSQNVSIPTTRPTSRKAETVPSTSSELSSTHKSASTSSTLSSTAEPSETTSAPTADSPSSTTGNSTSPAPAATVAPCKPSNNQTQPCSTRSMANHCLIVIASLAALATIFMVSTIVLCAKLSTRNYKVNRPQPATEMMCISALLPEKTPTYRRQRNPVSNGVLVFPGGGDSDDEGGDNLTLSSFLPDNDHYV